MQNYDGVQHESNDVESEREKALAAISYLEFQSRNGETNADVEESLRSWRRVFASLE